MVKSLKHLYSVENSVSRILINPCLRTVEFALNKDSDTTCVVFIPMELKICSRVVVALMVNISSSNGCSLKSFDM